MTPNQKKELVRHWYEDVLSGSILPREALATGVLDKEDMDLTHLFTPDYTNHVSPAPPGGWKRGIEAARQIIKAFRLSFPDLTLEVTEQMVGGDLVVTQYSVTSTHTSKAFFGMPATGKRYKLSGLGIEKIVDDKIAESWGAWDTYSLMEQMGILPNAAHLAG